MPLSPGVPTQQARLLAWEKRPGGQQGGGLQEQEGRLPVTGQGSCCHSQERRSPPPTCDSSTTPEAEVILCRLGPAPWTGPLPALPSRSDKTLTVLGPPCSAETQRAPGRDLGRGHLCACGGPPAGGAGWDAAASPRRRPEHRPTGSNGPHSKPLRFGEAHSHGVRQLRRKLPREISISLREPRMNKG